jgi:hypothetical protein
MLQELSRLSMWASGLGETKKGKKWDRFYFQSFQSPSATAIGRKAAGAMGERAVVRGKGVEV